MTDDKKTALEALDRLYLHGRRPRDYRRLKNYIKTADKEIKKLQEIVERLGHQIDRRDTDWGAERRNMIKRAAPEYDPKKRYTRDEVHDILMWGCRWMNTLNRCRLVVVDTGSAMYIEDRDREPNPVTGYHRYRETPK